MSAVSFDDTSHSDPPHLGPLRLHGTALIKLGPKFSKQCRSRWYGSLGSRPSGSTPLARVSVLVYLCPQNRRTEWIPMILLVSSRLIRVQTTCTSLIWSAGMKGPRHAGQPTAWIITLQVCFTDRIGPFGIPADPDHYHGRRHRLYNLLLLRLRS